MIIHTQRLMLRPITADDWEAVLAYQCDSRYLRYYAWTERSAAAVQQFVAELAALNDEHPQRNFHFGVVLPDDRLIGLANLRRTTVDASQADIGYEIAPTAWGHGYASEAATALLRFGFESLHLHRIWASCNADNAASARVLQKVGMQQEGRLRDDAWFKDRWWDTLLYGILDHEWAANAETDLAV